MEEKKEEVKNVNTKKCKHCKEEIALSANRCPKCGGNLGMETWQKILIIVVCVFVCFIACVRGCAGVVNEAVKETTNGYQDKNGKTSFKINETFENNYEKITITEVNTNFTEHSEYLSPKDGYKYVMIKIEVENINNEKDDLYIGSYDFNGYADGVAVKDAYVGNDQYEELSATVGKGKKAFGYAFYEVPVDAKKITVEYNANFITDGTTIEFIIQE